MGVILQLRTYHRSLTSRTRMISGEARGQAKQEESDGCHLWSFLTEGLHQEPDFKDQSDLWRGQRSGKAEGERWVSFS
jgi:hypothetical protein